MKLDQTDVDILRALQHDAKVNIKELADQVGRSKNPIYERIKKMEKEGIISKYVALVDTKRLESMVIFCSVSLESQHIDVLSSFEREIINIPEIVECYLMGGSYDYLLKVIVRSLDEYHVFSSAKLASIPHVRQIQSLFVLNEVKRSTIYPISKDVRSK